MGDIEFREAVMEDADSISDLIMSSQRQFCFHEYTPDGQELMAKLCGRKALKHYLERGDVYFVAEHGGRIIGVAGIRDNKHLAHNFVIRIGTDVVSPSAYGSWLVKSVSVEATLASSIFVPPHTPYLFTRGGDLCKQPLPTKSMGLHQHR